MARTERELRRFAIMTRILLALPALLITMAACQPVVAPDPGVPGTCAAAGLQNLIGQDVSALAAVLLPEPVRIIRPDEMVTMDFNPNRTNIRLDENDRIVEITCG